jgi:hypothetical protein
MKNFGSHLSSWVSILLLAVCSILYPSWIKEGYLDDWYLKISVFVASYGGLIASIIWYYQFLKNNK